MQRAARTNNRRDEYLILLDAQRKEQQAIDHMQANASGSNKSVIVVR